jgi:phytanoyl-CoA hydroxylase
VPPETCARIRHAFRSEVKPYTGSLKRQLTSIDEPHHFSDDGFVTNPIVNPHLRPQFPRFSRIERTVMEACPLVPIVATLLGAPPGMLQSAYYESSRGTHTHLDFNPIDRERPMLGVWIALEGIAETAGRFFLYPNSHSLPMDDRMARFAELAWANYRQAFVELDLDTAEAEAQALLSEITAEHGLAPIAPVLRTGDALFWTNHVLHGSHVPRPGGGSRNSLLFHFVELALLEAQGLAGPLAG